MARTFVSAHGNLLMQTIVHSPQEIDSYALDVLKLIVAQKRDFARDGATILLLSGGLGAGKTTFTQALARALHITETVPSPTFVIARFYPLRDNSDFARLVHIDAYRIENVNELRPLGWDQLLGDGGNLIVMEWPEMIKGRIPEHFIQLNFEVVDEKTRRISIVQQ